MANTVVDKKLAGGDFQYREDVYCMSKQDVVQPGHPLMSGLPDVLYETEQWLDTAPNPDTAHRHINRFYIRQMFINLAYWVKTSNAQTAAFFPIILRLFAKKRPLVTR